MNAIVNEKSVFGELLKTLFGYNGNPSLTEIIGYVTYLVITLIAFTQRVVQPIAKKESIPAQA
jgi:high-affinity iron transporter